MTESDLPDHAYSQNCFPCYTFINPSTIKMKAPAPLYMPYELLKKTKPDTKEFMLSGLKIPDKGGCTVIDK